MITGNSVPRLMFGPVNRAITKKILPAVTAAGVRRCVMNWIVPCALCQFANHAALKSLAWLVTLVIVLLNVYLL